MVDGGAHDQDRPLHTLDGVDVVHGDGVHHGAREPEETNILIYAKQELGLNKTGGITY